MRKLTFSNVLHGVAQLAGLDRDNISTSEFKRIRDLADARLALGWESGEWPDTLLVERRRFRPLWDSTTTYALNAEVYYAVEDKYYQSLTSSNTGNVPTDKSKWADSSESPSGNDWESSKAYVLGDTVKYTTDGEHYWCINAHTSSSSITPGSSSYWTKLVQFDRYIAYEQTNETKVGEFLSMHKKDPRNLSANKSYSFQLSSTGAHVLQNVSQVWVKGRKQRPLLTGDTYLTTSTYSSGDQVYFSGNFYDANTSVAVTESPTATASKWDLVEIPYIFQGYLIRGAYADYLRSTGNNELAAQADADAEAFMVVESDKLLRQQGQVKRLDVYSY
tara:strand:- start:3253 stop:4251 length:999 start_codon:yes stop_codon:yes gene_type:complete